MAEDTHSIDDSAIPVRASGTVQAEVDGELILLSPKDFAYFGTQGVGDVVWALVDGQRSVAQIVAELQSQYSAPEGVIRSETVEFLDAMAEVGLVSLR